jgi:hypothetical protein
MKIIIPIEVEISHPTHVSKKWIGSCKTLDITKYYPEWDASSKYRENPEDAVIDLSNAILKTITPEWLAMKIWEQFVKGNSNENIS